MSAPASFRERSATLFKSGLRRTRAGYTPLALACIGVLIFSEHRAFSEGFRAISPRLLLLIFLCIGLGHLCIGLATHFLFRALGSNPGFGLVLATHLNRLPARYIPGGIWQTVSRSLDFSAAGLEAKDILRLVLLEMGVALGLALLIGGICLWIAGPNTTGWLAPLLASTGLAGLVSLPVVDSVLTPNRRRIDLLAYGAGIAAFLPVWLLYASVFSLFLSHLGLSLGWPASAGIYLISWSAGFLAFFAPQGVGVFEVTAGYLATDSLSGAIIASLFAFRVIMIGADLMAYALYRLTRFGWICARRDNTEEARLQ